MKKAAFQASLAILTFLSLSLGLQARDDDVEALRERAQAMFEFEVGEWRSTWERLNADGNVVSSVSGTEKMSWTLDGTAIEMITRLDGAEHWERLYRRARGRDWTFFLLFFIPIQHLHTLHTLHQIQQLLIILFNGQAGYDLGRRNWRQSVSHFADADSGPVS